MMEVLQSMAKLLAPILTFTAEEVWLTLPSCPGKPESVHLTQFPEVNPVFIRPDLAETWKTLVAVKGEAAKAIEAARQNKVVGHSLDAAVEVAAPNSSETVGNASDDLRALLISPPPTCVSWRSRGLRAPIEARMFPGLSSA